MQYVREGEWEVLLSWATPYVKRLELGRLKTSPVLSARRAAGGGFRAGHWKHNRMDDSSSETLARCFRADMGGFVRIRCHTKRDPGNSTNTRNSVDASDSGIEVVSWSPSIW